MVGFAVTCDPVLELIPVDGNQLKDIPLPPAVKRALLPAQKVTSPETVKVGSGFTAIVITGELPEQPAPLVTVTL